MTIWQIIVWSFAGPFLFLLAMYGQTAYRCAVQPASPISIPKWPGSTTKEERHELLTSRLELVEEFKLALAGKLSQEKLENILTDDCMFEDVTLKFNNRDELAVFLLDLCPRYVEDIEFEVHSVHHSPHIMLLDWTLHITTKMMNYQVHLPMRTHLYLQEEEGREQVFRIKEEWWGKEHLTAKTTIGFIGDLHSQLRRFTGYLMIQGIKKGYV